jgi:primosomal protein N' (replication factor Y)
MSAFYDLVFDIPAGQTFSYRADEKNAASPGKRAMVPFGSRSRDSLGFIVAERESPPEGVDESSIKTIRRVVDKQPVFDGQDIELARWMAAYYLCGFGQALAAMIPSGRRIATYPALPGDTADLSVDNLELSSEQQSA